MSDPPDRPDDTSNNPDTNASEGSSRPSYTAAFVRIHKRHGWLLTLAAVFTLGVGGYLKSIVDPYLSIGNTIWLTMPLTITATCIAYLTFARISLQPIIYGFMIVGILSFSAFVGLSSGPAVKAAMHQTPSSTDKYEECLKDYSNTTQWEFDPNSPASPLWKPPPRQCVGLANQSAVDEVRESTGDMYVVREIRGYLRVYGISGFAVSIASGVFAGWSMNEFRKVRQAHRNMESE